VAVQFFAQPSLVCRVPAGAFVPPPAVGSAVVRLDIHPAPPVPVDDVATFFEVVRAGFGQKRKQLRNSLAAGLGLPADDAAQALAAAGIDPRRRAETLSLPEWSALAGALAERG
jgi:16S rRNA (adenine1518-N6/adenine1519-N6)-dimethyltransferase